MKIIGALSAQIDGELSVESGPEGTYAAVEFPL